MATSKVKGSRRPVSSARSKGLPGSFATAGREVEEGLTERLPELIEDAIEDAMKAAASGAVQKGLNAAWVWT